MLRFCMFTGILGTHVSFHFHSTLEVKPHRPCSIFSEVCCKLYAKLLVELSGYPPCILISFVLVLRATRAQWKPVYQTADNRGEKFSNTFNHGSRYAHIRAI